MATAFNYNIKYTDKGFLIFLDEILLAISEKSCENIWHTNIKISGEVYIITKPRKLNSPVCIHDMNAGEKSGSISVPLFPFFFRKSVFFRESKPSITWCSKNLYSFHWVWKQHREILLEGVEDILHNGSNGVIKTTEFQDETYFLIVIGIFLSMYRKRWGVWGFLHKRHINLIRKKELDYLSDAI
ncbi:MAG: hypothetical protein JNM14_13365 [Ferruginibacter sp.]|nr:hypothetical protein [Ferruginibacter sp.]